MRPVQMIMLSALWISVGVNLGYIGLLGDAVRSSLRPAWSPSTD